MLEFSLQELELARDAVRKHIPDRLPAKRSSGRTYPIERDLLLKLVDREIAETRERISYRKRLEEERAG